MKVLLTGSTGFIGQHLVHHWRGKYDLVAIQRSVSTSAPDGVDVIRANLRDPDIQRLLPDRVDAVVHLAQANASFPEGGPELLRVNVGSAITLAEYAVRSNAERFVYFSSGSVYCPASCPIPEMDAPACPPSFYGMSKRMAELALGFYAKDIRMSCLRLFAPYGPGLKGRMIANVIQRVLTEAKICIRGGGQPRMNPIHVDDVLVLLDRLMESDACGTINVAGPEIVSIADIARIASSAVGKTANFIEQPGTGEDLIADTKALCSILPEHQFVNPTEGIHEFALSMQKGSLT